MRPGRIGRPNQTGSIEADGMTIREAAPSPLLLVTIDRLPLGLLPPYGCSWVAMPVLNGLAGSGVVLDRVITTTDNPHDVLAALAGAPACGAEGPWPLLAAAAALGLSPTLITDDSRLAATVPPPFAPCYVPLIPTASVAADPTATNLGRLFAAAADRLATGDHRLVWCHAGSLGQIWDAPEEFRAAYLDTDDPPPPPGAAVPDLVVDATTDPDLIVGLRHVLAGQLTLLDHCLGGLLDAVPETDGQPWTILVAGIRGLGLGLHGRLGCGPLPPYGELIHVPAVLVDPEGRMAAQRTAGLVTPADIGATLLQWIGRTEADGDDPRSGRSLEPLLESWREPSRDRVICTAAHGTAVVTPAWHLVMVGADGESPKLYAKPDDFFELNDVADRCPVVAEELASLASLATAAAHEAWTTPFSESAIRGV